MRRLPVLAPLLAAAALWAAGAGGAAAMPREKAVVEDEVIRLGDLFPIAGDKAGIVVGMAPRPGGTAVFDAARLSAIARRYGVAWAPYDRSDRVVVERAGRRIDQREVEQALLRALPPQGLDGPVRIDLADRRLNLFAPPGAADPLRIEEISLDPVSLQFTARVAVAGDAAPAWLRGKVVRMIAVPTPVRNLRKGDVIEPDDLDSVQLPSDSLATDIVRDADRLVGTTPRRSLRAGEPVRLGQVEQPVVVTKGALVTMTLRTAHMTLTATGKALENGAEGATIKVRNARSRNTVVGVVTGPGQVSVPHPTAPAPARRQEAR